MPSKVTFAALFCVVFAACTPAATTPPPQTASGDGTLYYAPTTAPSASVSPSDLEAQTLALQIRIARATAAALRVASAVKLAQDAPCPTAESLVADHAVSEKMTPVDPWGTPYRIACAAGAVRVTAAGPDQRFDTPDDVTVP